VTTPEETAGRGDRPAETVAGFLAALALAAGGLSLAYRPVRLGIFAIIAALVAAGIGGRHGRLAAIAAVVATVCWVVGMTIAILTRNPIY
jgi:hypothetical protein